MRWRRRTPALTQLDRRTLPEQATDVDSTPMIAGTEELAEFLRKRLDTSYRLAAVILRDASEAEEATAAAFATAWRRSWRLSRGEDTDTWLQQILVAACRDRWRRLLWVEPEVPTAQPGPRRDRFAHAAERDALLRAIAHLAPEDRT